jgi:hypothetical protein
MSSQWDIGVAAPPPDRQGTLVQPGVRRLPYSRMPVAHRGTCAAPRRRPPRHTPARHVAAAALLLLAWLAPATSQAQTARRGAGSLSGRLVNQLTREPVGGARIQLVGSGVAIFTDSAGRFGMDRLPSGEVNIEARAIGYRMGRWQLNLPVGLTVERVFEMEPMTVGLDTVNVEATPNNNWRSETGFDYRRRRGIGYFITRADIDQRQTAILNDLLIVVPGLYSSCGGGVCRVQMMANGRNCSPEWFLDGHPATNAAGPDFPTQTIRGVEVYRSLFEVPPEFQRSNLRCGVIAIWTR